MRMFGLPPRSLRKIFAEVSHHACILPPFPTCPHLAGFAPPEQPRTPPDFARISAAFRTKFFILTFPKTFFARNEKIF